MKMSSNRRNIAYYLNLKPKIITSLLIAVLAVFIALMLEMSTGNIGHSQIRPANISENIIENNTLSSLQMAEKNMTSNQSALIHTQNSSATGILSNSSLVKTITNSTNNLKNATKAQSPIPSIKITSHIKGQTVSEGTLSINGVSSDNSASTCDVYVLLNGIKPYQRVVPAGQSGSSNGTKDYSLWKFTFLPTYGLITEGDNKMTAKITCMNGSVNATKFNSLNVTGVSSNSANSNLGLTQSNPFPLNSSNNVTTNDPDPVQGNSTPLMSTYSPPENVPQAPAAGGITPQTNNGIAPTSSLSEEIPAQNSSFVQQEEQLTANSNSILEADNEPREDQLDSGDEKISTQTKKAVDEFIARVQGTVEERLDEAIKMRTPFELVTPTP